MSVRPLPRPSEQTDQPRRQPGFYDQALPEPERPVYQRAREARGLAEEIALIRLKLFVLLETGAANGAASQTPAIARLLDLLIKALRAEGRDDHDDRELLDSLLDDESERILATARQK